MNIGVVPSRRNADVITGTLLVLLQAGSDVPRSNRPMSGDRKKGIVRGKEIIHMDDLGQDVHHCRTLHPFLSFSSAIHFLPPAAILARNRRLEAFFFVYYIRKAGFVRLYGCAARDDDIPITPFRDRFS